MFECRYLFLLAKLHYLLYGYPFLSSAYVIAFLKSLAKIRSSKHRNLEGLETPSSCNWSLRRLSTMLFEDLMESLFPCRWVITYAADQNRFFQDFASAYQKLVTQGVTWKS